MHIKPPHKRLKGSVSLDQAGEQVYLCAFLCNLCYMESTVCMLTVHTTKFNNYSMSQLLLNWKKSF
jgi:hypothetical protein